MKNSSKAIIRLFRENLLQCLAIALLSGIMALVDFFIIFMFFNHLPSDFVNKNHVFLYIDNFKNNNIFGLSILFLIIRSSLTYINSYMININLINLMISSNSLLISSLLYNKASGIANNVIFRNIVVKQDIREAFINGVRYSSLIISELSCAAYMIVMLLSGFLLLGLTTSLYLLPILIAELLAILYFKKLLSRDKNIQVTESLLEAGRVYSEQISNKFSDLNNFLNNSQFYHAAEVYRNFYYERRMLSSKTDYGLSLSLLPIFLSVWIYRVYHIHDTDSNEILSSFIMILMGGKKIYSTIADVLAMFPLIKEWGCIINKNDSNVCLEFEVVYQPLGQVKSIIVLGAKNYSNIFIETFKMNIIHSKIASRISNLLDLPVVLSPYQTIPDSLISDNAFVIRVKGD